jgi:sugar lactone lactonase YvrE
MKTGIYGRGYETPKLPGWPQKCKREYIGRRPLRIAIEVFVVALLRIASVDAQQFVISTYAGGAPPPTPMVGVQASILPSVVVADSSGNLYFSGFNSVFQLDSNGVMTRIAGTSRAGYSGDGGPAASAQLNNPVGLALDASGNLYIADSFNNSIRMVSPSGVIATVAGNSSAGYSGDGGPATNAQLSHPLGISVDGSGNLYIVDYYNDRIRKVSAAGIITTVAGNGSTGDSGDGGPATGAQLNAPFGVAIDSGGNLFIAEHGGDRVRKVSAGGIITTVAGNGSQGYSGDGGPATSAQLYNPGNVAVDANGNLYIADSLNNRIRKVSAGGIMTTVAGNGSQGYSGDGGRATSAQLYQPQGLTVDARGNLYIADTYNYRIRMVSPAGIIDTVAGDGFENYSGDGGPATAAQLNLPSGVAMDASGNLYIADSLSYRVRKVSAEGIITTVAGNGSQGYSGDGGPAASAQLESPASVAADANGNLYVSDNNRIRKISAGGIITTVAGAGSLYPGDGGPATEAQLAYPVGMAVDANGSLYIADWGASCIRKISAAGIITTIAGDGITGYSGDGGPAASARLNGPSGVAVDAAGNVYIADAYNHRVRMVSPAGIITTVAGNGSAGYSGDGGPATAAQLGVPEGVAVDASGNLYIADSGNERIRKVSAAGIIATVAGNGAAGYSGDGGPATGARLFGPMGVAAGAGGNLYVADFINNAIRLLRLRRSGVTGCRDGEVGGYDGCAGGCTGQSAPGRKRTGCPAGTGGDRRDASVFPDPGNELRKAPKSADH